MSPALFLELTLVAAVTVTAVMRAYRQQHRPGLSSGDILLHEARLGGILLTGFGLLGLLLDGAGYGGTGPTVEVPRVGFVLGIPVGGPGYEEGHTRLWELSTGAVGVGVLLMAGSSFALWWSGLRGGPRPRAGA